MVEKRKLSFIEHCLIIGSGTVISMAISMLTTPIITRLVPPAEYGQLSIFNMYTSMAVMVLCLGLDQALVRYYYQYKDAESRKKVFLFCAGLPIVFSMAILMVLGILNVFHIISFEFSALITFALLLNIFINIVYRFSVLLLRVTYKSKQYTIANILFRLSYVVLALMSCTLNPQSGVGSLVFATVVGYLVATIYSLIMTRFYLGRIDFSSNKKSEINRKEILLYGLPQILSLGLTTLFQAIDKLSLNYYCNYDEVGIYSSAMILINFFSIVQTTFNSMWAPKQIEHYMQAPEDKEYYRHVNAIVVVVMFVIGIHLILLKNVFAYLLGESYREAAYIIPFLIFNPIMYTISETTCGGISFLKKSHVNIWVSVSACLANFIGNTLLVPILGARGAAISTGISYIVFWALRTVFSNHYYKVDYSLGKFLLLMVSVCLFAWYNIFHNFDFVVFGGYLTCMGILFLLYHTTIKKLLGRAIRFIQKKKGV